VTVHGIARGSWFDHPGLRGSRHRDKSAAEK
jgi:hypothetical protein